MIEEYHFGSITINGKTYNYDVEVRWNGEVLEWRRESSHVIDIEGVKRAVEEKPEMIIIGTGESGVARVTESAQRFIKEKKIELIIDRTEEAVKVFNMIRGKPEREKGEKKKVIGLFHLTC